MKNRIRTAFAEIHADDALMDSTKTYLCKELNKKRHKNKSYILPRHAITFAAVAILLVGIFSHNLYFTADAYVSIDVNPSIELTLNRFNRVIGAYAFNEDGARILSEVNPRWKVFDEAAGLVIHAIETDGYLTEDSLVSVTVQAAESERKQVLCSALQQSIDEQILSIQVAAEVEVFPVTTEIWDNARSCNMSPAKYLAIKDLIEVDEEATIEAYSDSTIRQIRNRTQECRHAHNAESDDRNSEPVPRSEHGNGQGQGHGCRGGH